ncbi:MAG: M48 family metalloprotease [Promethearchaeota archaeon]
MKKFVRWLILIFYVLISLGLFYLFYFLIFPFDWSEIFINWILLMGFIGTIILYPLSINEFYHWAKIGRRSEGSDIVAIGFLFFLILFITRDFLTSMMGSFSIYMWFGVYELKEYPVINKILIISLVTYNIIFVAGLVSFYLNDPFFVNTAFAFSFWIILGLGFLLFGRKYIIVWRFMSPAYLLLFLYIIAWLAVIFINQYTPLEFIYNSPLALENFSILNFIMNIYFILILVNWIVYFIAGAVLDKLLGIKRVKNDEKLLEIVEKVKKDIGIKGKVKVGFGKYPILNAMAYGSFFDKRIAIIAEDINQIPEDELKGIIAHELAHTKGQHTLILTFITTFDLIFRMLLGLPATYYDYTFGEPQIPMIAFIFINLVLYMFFFIFIRLLEGRADLKAKKAGYGKELAKALYNLESFYASGREIGLNTMLLCDEKILEDNQLLDYMDTAEYMHCSMIKPSRLSLLANLMNSHPPSYYRIAALLSDELKPSKIALLPFICLKKSKQIKYAEKFEKARLAFKIIANEKFKEKFKVENVSLMLEKLQKRETHKYELNKDFIFKNKITNELILGKLEDIQFLDDICDTEQYIITNLKTTQKQWLNASIYAKNQINLNELYFFQKKMPLTLIDVKINKSNKDGNYLFLDKDNNEILKPIKKTKLPNSVNIFKKFKDREVFLRLKGEVKIFKCINIKPSENFNNYELEFFESNEKRIQDQNPLKFRISKLIIRPKNIYFSIRRNVEYRQSEIALIKWLITNQLQTSIYLKKPVNNLEIGRILNINLDDKKIKLIQKHDGDNKDLIFIKNIFGKEKSIPYKTIEQITFEYNTAMIQKKSETSIFSRLGYKLIKKFKPEKVII